MKSLSNSLSYIKTTCPRHYRKVIRLHKYGLRGFEIADVLGLSRPRVSYILCTFVHIPHGRVNIPEYLMSEQEIAERPGLRDRTDWGGLVRHLK